MSFVLYPMLGTTIAHVARELIFLSYRRRDASNHAGRLYDSLRVAFGQARVFRDVHIPAGRSFPVALSEGLAQTRILLVLIHEGWLDSLQTSQPGNWIAGEIERGLEAPPGECIVVPVLLDGATMPAAAQLPLRIGELAMRQPALIRDHAWDRDVEALISRIAEVTGWERIGDVTGAHPIVQQKRSRSREVRRSGSSSDGDSGLGLAAKIGAAVGVAALVLAAAFVILWSPGNEVTDDASSSVAAEPVSSGEALSPADTAAATQEPAGPVATAEPTSDFQPATTATVAPQATVTTEREDATAALGVDPTAAPAPTSVPAQPAATTPPQPATATPVPPAATPLPAQPAPTAIPIQPTALPQPTATTPPPQPTATAAPAAAAATLAAPTDLRVTRQGITNSGSLFISLEWWKVQGVPFVQIERDGVIIRDDDNLAYQDVPGPTVATNQVITYRARALDGSAVSAWSNPITVTVGQHELPIPTRLRATNQGIAGSGRPFIALAWLKPSGIPMVQIERDGVIVTDDHNIAYQDVPDPPLVTGQIVTYRVRATSPVGTSPWSDPVAVTVTS